MQRQPSWVFGLSLNFCDVPAAASRERGSSRRRRRSAAELLAARCSRPVVAIGTRSTERTRSTSPQWRAALPVLRWTLALPPDRHGCRAPQKGSYRSYGRHARAGHRLGPGDLGQLAAVDMISYPTASPPERAAATAPGTARPTRAAPPSAARPVPRRDELDRPWDRHLLAATPPTRSHRRRTRAPVVRRRRPGGAARARPTAVWPFVVLRDWPTTFSPAHPSRTRRSARTRWTPAPQHIDQGDHIERGAADRGPVPQRASSPLARGRGG